LNTQKLKKRKENVFINKAEKQLIKLESISAYRTEKELEFSTSK
jgi:hypothetical protein